MAALEIGIEGHDTVQVLEGLSTGEIVVKPSQPAGKLPMVARSWHHEPCFKDIRKNLGRFVITTIGIGMLLMS